MIVTMIFGAMTFWIGFGVAVEICDRKLNKTLDLLGVKKLGAGTVSIKMDMESEFVELGRVKEFFLGDGPTLQEVGDRMAPCPYQLRDAEEGGPSCGTCPHFDGEEGGSCYGPPGVACTFDDWVCNAHPDLKP